MLKFFLLGFVCIGAGSDQKCVRVGSEVIFNNYEECAQYFDVVQKDVIARDKTVSMNFTCVSSGVLEDLL
mgnify:CR=1 FL=1|jgi:hypothetical protein|tara:strand:- start:545 stop:754 length:210 start_codon:yes stop_codon:yes gene_type:complete